MYTRPGRAKDPDEILSLCFSGRESSTLPPEKEGRNSGISAHTEGVRSFSILRRTRGTQEALLPRLCGRSGICVVGREATP